MIPEGLCYGEIAFNIPLKQTFTYLIPEDCPAMGIRVEVMLRNRKVTGWLVSTSKEKPGDYKIQESIRIIDEEPLFAQETLELARWISRFYLCSLGEALFTILPGGKVEKELPALGLAEKAKHVEIEKLTDQQSRAIEALKAEPRGLWYLQGITGSGKTEVYLSLADQMLEKGRGVIFLVPEISLTHQMVDDLGRRYGDKLAILHSHLTQSQRLKQWKRILEGEATMVLGARSAVFAPVKNLGMIILDEEHEGSYKAGNTPRYHGRQVAMYRSSQNQGLLLMGSATPSLEAWALMEKGKLKRLVMDQRAAGGGVPRMVLVDMKHQQGILSEELIRDIHQVCSQDQQVILFLNRRGFSYHFHCKTCNYELHCRQCSVPLTYHKQRNRMICHYCGYQTPPPRQCPECQSMDVGYSGFGTEQIEEEVARIFPDYPLVRLDRDQAQKKGESRRILKEFQQGKYKILLGTQMVAKGLNFPKVRLVGIILADTTLNLPDFRSPERTFGLITQVAGRAGRYSKDGRVVLQTFRPDSPALKMAVEQQQEQFYRQEWETRKMLQFPPARRLIRLVFRGKQERAVEEQAHKAASVMQSWGMEGLMGPAECPLAVISGNYRYQLLIPAEDFSRVHQWVASYLEQVEMPSTVYREVDVDPISLL